MTAKRTPRPASVRRALAADTRRLRSVRAEVKDAQRALLAATDHKGRSYWGQELAGLREIERVLSERTRANPPMEADVSHLGGGGGGGRGVLASRNVLELKYVHALSRQRTPYVHPFVGGGVHMYFLPDGSIHLRHATRRLWEDRVVGESE